VVSAELGHGDDRVGDRPSERGQAVLDAYGNLRVDLAGDQAVSLETTEAFGHHLLGDAGKARAETTGAANPSRHGHDQRHLPFSLQHFETECRLVDQQMVARFESPPVVGSLGPYCGGDAASHVRICLSRRHARQNDDRRATCRYHWRVDSGAAAGSLDAPASCIAARERLGNTQKVVQRCLIVDDSQAFLSSARALLESQGMTVTACALSGEEALALARRTQPQLALVDVELAGEDGCMLARSLIAQDPTLRVILVSAYELEDIAELVVGCGASGFISKIALGKQAIEALLEF
jgi:CheY-like chemotaxis protein